MAERPPAPASARPLWMVVLALPLAAAALWGASRLTWATRTRTVPGTGQVVGTDVPGAEVAPELVPLALLALAAVAGVLALGGTPRRVLGGVVVLAGLVPLWSALVAHPEATAVARALTAAAGLLVLAAGALTAARGHRMPRLGARYRAPGASRDSARTERDLWQALSDGDDPTAAER